MWKNNSLALVKIPVVKNYGITLIRGNYATSGRQIVFHVCFEKEKILWKSSLMDIWHFGTEFFHRNLCNKLANMTSECKPPDNVCLKIVSFFLFFKNNFCTILSKINFNFLSFKIFEIETPHFILISLKCPIISQLILYDKLYL